MHDQERILEPLCLRAMHHRSNLECAVEAAARLDNILARQGKIKPPSLPLHNSIKPSEIFSSEFIINDLPQSARAVLTKGITCEEISSFSGTKITVKGGILSPEEKEKGTEKKPLHLFIQGPNKQSIDLAIQRINNLVLEISQCHNNPLMTANMSQPPPQYINVVQNMQGVEKVLVGLDHAPPSFDVRNKVLGPGGANLAYIMQETGAGVTLRGKGSGFLEAHSGQESLEPLHICVEHNKPEVLQNARQLAFSLIETLQRELQNQQQQMQQQQQQMQQQQQQIQQQTQLVQQVQVTQAVDQMGNIINLQPGEQLPQGVQLSSTTIQVPILTQPFTQAGLGQMISVPPPQLGMPPPQLIQTQGQHHQQQGQLQVTTSQPPPQVSLPPPGHLQYIQQVVQHPPPSLQNQQILTSQPPPMLTQHSPQQSNQQQQQIIQNVQQPNQQPTSNTTVLPQHTQLVQTYPTVQYIQTANGQLVAVPTSAQPGQQLILNQLPPNVVQQPLQGQYQGQTGVQPGTVTLLQASGGQPGQHILLGQNQAVHLAQLQQIPGGSPGQEPNDGTQQQGPPQQQQQTSVNAPGNPGAQGSNVAPSVNGNIGPGNVTSNENKSEVKPDIKVEKDSSSSSSHPPPPQQASVPPSQRAPPRNVQRGHAATPGSKPVPPPTGGAGAPQSGVPHGQKRSYEEIYQNGPPRGMSVQGVGTLAPSDGKPPNHATRNEKPSEPPGDWNGAPGNQPQGPMHQQNQPMQQQNQQMQQQNMQQQNQQMQQQNMQQQNQQQQMMNMHPMHHSVQPRGPMMNNMNMHGNDGPKPEVKRMRGPPPPHQGGGPSGNFDSASAPNPARSNNGPLPGHYSSKPQLYNSSLPFHLQGLAAPPPPPPPAPLEGQQGPYQAGGNGPQGSVQGPPQGPVWVRRPRGARRAPISVSTGLAPHDGASGTATQRSHDGAPGAPSANDDAQSATAARAAVNGEFVPMRFESASALNVHTYLLCEPTGQAFEPAPEVNG
ncbi:hypothetical protein M8J75_015688 [Diaphorina citri]|nr:hypothetical protein M8J75_015688 [Diaphorina citri]